MVIFGPILGIDGQFCWVLVLVVGKVMLSFPLFFCFMLFACCFFPLLGFDTGLLELLFVAIRWGAIMDVVEGVIVVSLIAFNLFLFL